MTTFGDFDEGADTHDDAPPDPEAVARLLWALLITRLPKRFKAFEAHTPEERQGIIDAVRALLQRLRDEGPG